MDIMRRRDLIALGIVAFTTAACGSDGATPSPSVPTPPAPPPSPPPPSASLTVASGVQTATQLAGATRDVFADVDPAGQVFDRWTGDTALLLTPSERQSGARARAPSTAATVTATYRPQSPFTLQSGRIAGSTGQLEFYYYFPQSLPTRGLVFRFHGTGGGARTAASGTEAEKFDRDLVADGYAFVTLDSDDRVDKQWDNRTANTTNPAANIDVAHVQQVLAFLTTQGLINASTRLFASGHSNGGGFAPLVAALLRWRGCQISCAPGGAAIQQQTTVPTIWTIAQNDTIVGASGNATAQANYQILAGRGIAAQIITYVPSAVYASRFAQISGLTVSDSQTIYNAIKAASLLDGNDYQLAAPSQTALTGVVPTIYTPYSAEIVNLLRLAYAEHEFSSYSGARVRSFLGAT